MLEDAAWQIRVQAAEALGNMSTPRTVPSAWMHYTQPYQRSDLPPQFLAKKI
jgi:hypothetical protein